MRTHVMIVLPIACLLMLACASRPLPKQIPETMRAACDLYTQAKPDVLRAREYAKAHWETIPEEWKPTLRKLDSYLPRLDEAGQMICAAAAAVDVFNADKRVDWDDVLSTVLRAVSIAAELKAKGVI